MSKVTAEFGKNNTSTSSLASKSKVLNEQIERQKEKIEKLKGALQQSSEKYGENDKRITLNGLKPRFCFMIYLNCRLFVA